MSRKLDKIGEELARTRARYEAYGKRIQELEDQYAEQEKTEINEIVRAANLTPDQLYDISRLNTYDALKG